MRVAILSPYLPHRRVGHGGGVAVRGLARNLARLHEVTLISLVRPGEHRHLDEVASLGLRVEAIPYTDQRARGPRRLALAAARLPAVLRSLRSGYPLYAEKYWSPRLSRHVIDICQRCRPEIVQIEYLQMALHARELRGWRDALPAAAGGLQPKLILNSHELGSLPLQRRAELAATPSARARLLRRAAAWERLQSAATRWADATLCVTEQDRQLLADQGGVNCVTMPLGVDTEEVKPTWAPEQPLRLLFVGSFAHRPNRIAAKFLIDKVWPSIAQYLPEAQLILAGRGSDGFIRALGPPDPRIQALGFVEDLTELYRVCRLFAAPLPEGGGIKIKILEAMARGIPVVTTPIGAEGIVDSAEDALTVAPPNAAFAEAMIQALAAPDMLRARAGRARRIIEERFSWSAIAERLTEIYGGR